MNIIWLSFMGQYIADQCILAQYIDGNEDIFPLAPLSLSTNFDMRD